MRCIPRPGVPRAAYRKIIDVLGRLGRERICARRFEQLAATFTDRGVTFAFGGEERPFPLDLIPRVIAAARVGTLAAGVRQRVLALEAFLDDVYGEGHGAFDDGVMPRRLILTSPHFRREAVGLPQEYGARITVSGIDIVRDERGNAVRSRGQRAHSLGRVVRDREPSRDDPELSIVVLALSRASCR